jgi:predicted N-acetyltransferase YhbS
MNIIYSNTITPDEFNALRAAVGWSVIERSLATKGLENTAFIICARNGEKAIGMARVITDYGYVVYIADVIVLPEYQGKGIGGEIMSRVMMYINDNIAQGQGKSIILMSAKGKEEFYEKFGFVKRPTDNVGCGMTQWIKKEGNDE